MRYFIRVVVCLLGAFLWCGPASAMPAPAGSRNSVVIVFKDGHKQSLDLADVVRIDFKAPERSYSRTDISRVFPVQTLCGSNSCPLQVFRPSGAITS